MKNLVKLLLVTLFVARIAVPMGEKHTYPDVTKVEVVGESYKLTLFSGKTVYVPVQFTVIEER